MTFIGELMAGVILGPSLLNLIGSEEVIKLLAEIGIIKWFYGRFDNKLGEV